MKNIFKKTFKFISSRLIYLVIGIFIAIGATYVYAAWNDAKTGDSGQLGQSNWNALVNEVHNKCGSNCDTAATGATASSDILTENNWNNLVDLTDNTLVDCTADNGGKCFINQTSKSTLDTDLVAGNIKSGVNVFGVAGSANIRCKVGIEGECWSSYCTLGTDCNVSCTQGMYWRIWNLQTRASDGAVFCQVSDHARTAWGICWLGTTICEWF